MRLTRPTLPKRHPASSSPAPAPAAVQTTHVRAVACLGDALVLRAGRCRAVLEVAGLPVATLPEDEQEAILAGLLRLFGGLSHPVQLVVRTEPVDLEAHAAEVERANAGDPALTDLARGYAAYVRNLAAARALLRRRCLVVVPADAGLPWGEARRQLVARCDELLRAFARLRMPARRLGSGELHALEAAVWRPGARIVPLDAAAPSGELPAVLSRTGGLDAALSVLAPAARETRARQVIAALPGPLRRLARRWERRVPPDDAAAARALWTSAATFAGRISPAAAGHTPLSFRLQDSQREATRTLRVTAWPRVTVLAWLTPLVTLDETVDVSLHLTPADTRKALRGLKLRLAVLQASRLKNLEHGRPDDPELVTAIGDLERVQLDVSVAGEKLWDAALYVHLRARGDHAERALGDGKAGLQAKVEAAIARTAAEAHVAAYQQPEGFQAVEPLADDPLRTTHALDTRSVARALPFVVGTETGRGILLGSDRLAHGPVLYDAGDPAAFNSNLAVLAPSGSGKSYATKLLAARHRLLGWDVWVVDPEAEFLRLCRAQGGQVVTFAGSGGSRVNPLDLPEPDTDDDGHRIDPVRERAGDVAGLVETMLTGGAMVLSPGDRAAVERAVLAAYRQRGILPNQPETWTLEPPILADVQTALSATHGELGELLEPFTAGLLCGPFCGQTDVDLTRPFVAFDLSKTGDRLRPVVVATITGHVWRQVRRERKPRLLVVDEAASVLRTPEGARFMGEMARRARKYYLALVTIVQNVAHLEGNAAGVDVLTNAGTKLVLGQDGETIGPVAELFRLSDAERTDLLAADKGEGLLLGRASRRFVRVTASPEEHRLITTDPAELRRIEAEERAAHAVAGDRAATGRDGGGGRG